MGRKHKHNPFAARKRELREVIVWGSDHFDTAPNKEVMFYVAPENLNVE